MHISLATGLGSGPRRRGGPPQPADESPRLLRAPALVGTGRIGATLTVDPGVWADARDLAFAWLRDGAPIPGATGPVYAPVPADDRAALACRVAALNAAGRTTADTPAVAAAFPPPLPLGPIPDLILTQGTGPHHVDISSFFSGESLRFSVTGEGVVIDPATGVATVSAEALLSGVSLLVAAENSGGRAELRFGLKVAPAFVAPAPTTLPALLGGGRVGEPLGVTPGVWSGDPAPELTLQWLRGGVPVAGATGDRYVPGAAEDGLAVACRVTARNVAGEAAAETEAVTVTQVPPVTAGALADVVFAQGPGGRTLPAAGAFAGAALRFSVTGAGAEIDPATGVATIPTATARAAETVTVTAANSGGEAQVRFAVTVMAAPAATGTPQPAVFALAPGSRGVATQSLFTGPNLVYALEGAPAGVTVDAGTGVVTVPTGAALQAGFTVAASNAVGVARQTLAVTVLAAPAAVGTPPPSVFAVAAGSRTISTQAFFTGASLVYALEGAPAGVTIDAGSGLVTVPTGAASQAGFAVRASNAVGAARQTLAVTVLTAPTTVGTPQPVVFAVGAGTRSVPTQALFAGAGLSYALEGAPAGVTIDAGTGVVTVPTAAPLQATPTVRASNVAGAARQGLPVSVLAAPTAVGTPEPAVFALEAGTRTISTQAFFAGAGLSYALEGAPAGVTVNAGSGLVTVPTGTALQASFTVAASNVAGAARQSFAVTVRAMATSFAAGTGVRSPGDAALTWAAGQGYMTFDVAGANETRATTNDQANHHAPLLMALAAHAGNARSYAGAGATLSPAAWTRGQIAHWVGGASTTANDNAPAAFGGYTAQYEATCAAVIAVARRTPAVWDGLTAAQRTRCDLLMRGLLVSSVWATSDDNPYVAGGAQASLPERDMRGYPCGRDFNANFSLPMALVAYVCAGYFGVSAADAFLRGFDRAAFAAELGSAGGFWDMWNTFRQNWTSNDHPGPTAAQLELTCRGPLVNGARTGFRTRGVGLSGLMTIVDRELTKMWNGVIRPGFQRSPGNYGVPEDTAAGRLTNVADFAGLPNEGLTGQAQELQSSDADGSRSSMDYGHHGFQAALAMLAALAVQGVLPLENADMIDIGNRMNRGVADLRYKSERGYVDYRRGSRDTRNGEWSISRRAAWGLPHLYSGWEDAMRPWFFQPRPSAAPAVTGTARVGQTLTGTVGSWASNHGSAISLSRQWEEETSAGVWSGIGTATAGTANATYSPTAGNVGRRLRLRVTATNGVTSTTAWSAPTAAVTAA